MELNSSPKQLLKHTVPVLMIVTMLFVVSAVTLSGPEGLGSNRAQSHALARGLITRVFRVRPTANGLARVSLNNTATAQTVTPGSSLADGVSQAGQVAQRSFELQ